MGEARRLPIGTGIVIDRRRLLDLVDQLRAAVPAEIHEAREILNRKEAVLEQADEEVALRLARADEEADRRVSESEVKHAADVRGEQVIAQAQGDAERLQDEAQKKAQEKVAEGERLSAEQMDEADRYALEMLRKLEQQLDAFVASVRSGIETLDGKSDADAPAEPAGQQAAVEGSERES